MQLDQNRERHRELLNARRCELTRSDAHDFDRTSFQDRNSFMRIAQVSHSLDCGGSMALVVSLSCELMKRGHQVEVICLDRQSGSAHEAVWIKLLAQQGIALYFLGRRRGAMGLTAAAKLWWMVQRKGYDIVHSHLPMPDAISGLVRRLSPHPFAHVITVHNTYEPRSRTLGALGSGANVVYCSAAVGRSNQLPGVSSTVIPNGIPQEQHVTAVNLRSTVRQDIGVDSSAKIVMAVGRLCPQKNFSAVIEALAELKRRNAISDLHCLICGDGEERKALETRAGELGIESIVHFMGARTDVPNLLKASDAFLSTSRHEGMPLSVLEALNAGLPCVLSAIQEHYELASMMPGCVFVLQNPAEIASGLETVLCHPLDPDELRERRAIPLQKHSMEQCAESYDYLYQACCGSKALPHQAHS